MLLWRITREAHQELDGEGARKYGGRWNSSGVAVVYTSSTLSLAALEYLVHIDPEDIPDDLVAMRIEAPDGEYTKIAPDALPADWNQLPDHPACIEAGDAWADVGETLALFVPSAVIPEERNVLLNPAHPDAGDVEVHEVRRFSFDARLIRRR